MQSRKDFRRRDTDWLQAIAKPFHADVCAHLCSPRGRRWHPQLQRRLSSRLAEQVLNRCSVTALIQRAAGMIANERAHGALAGTVTAGRALSLAVLLSHRESEGSMIEVCKNDKGPAPLAMAPGLLVARWGARKKIIRPSVAEFVPSIRRASRPIQAREGGMRPLSQASLRLAAERLPAELDRCASKKATKEGPTTRGRRRAFHIAHRRLVRKSILAVHGYITSTSTCYAGVFTTSRAPKLQRI